MVVNLKQRYLYVNISSEMKRLNRLTVISKRLNDDKQLKLNKNEKNRFIINSMSLLYFRV